MRRARRRQYHVHRSADRGSLARQGSDRGLFGRDILHRRGIPASGGQARDHGCRTLGSKTTNAKKRDKREETVLNRIVASMALAITALVAAMSLAHADAL